MGASNWKKDYQKVDIWLTKDERKKLSQKAEEKKIKDVSKRIISNVRAIAKQNEHILLENDEDCEECNKTRDCIYIHKEISPIIIKLAKRNCLSVQEYIKKMCVLPIIENN